MFISHDSNFDISELEDFFEMGLDREDYFVILSEKCDRIIFC